MIIDIQPEPNGLILFSAETDVDWRELTDKLYPKAEMLSEFCDVCVELREASRQLLIMIICEG